MRFLRRLFARRKPDGAALLRKSKVVKLWDPSFPDCDGAIVFERTLSDEEVKALREEWQRRFSGPHPEGWSW